MPGKNVCSRIADPAARRRCENYQGEFSQQPAGPAGTPRAGAGSFGAPAGGRMGGPGMRPPRRKGGGGFGGY